MGRGRQIIRIAAFATVALLASCARYDDAYFVHSVWRPADGAVANANVYFVTDRNKNPYMPYGFDYGGGETTSCGMLHAAIPPARLPGGPSLFAQETGREAMACGTHNDAVAQAVAAAARAKNCNSVLVYVHGFNTGFETAVLRAAQLGSDTQWRCAVLAFSWSSTGKRLQYDADVQNSARAEPLFAGLLRALAAQGLRTNIVAHSMGAKLALGALAQANGVAVDEAVFAAPDIGMQDFTAALPAAARHLHRLTIYASSEDAALSLSRRINRGAARVGRAPDANYGDANIDVIDASDAPAGVMGHEYYGLSYETLADMALTLAGVRATERLNPRGATPPTLIRDKTYRLNVAPGRTVDVLTRALRWLISLFAG